MDEKKRRKGESESESAKMRSDTSCVRRLKVEPHSNTETRTSNSKTHKQPHGQYGTTEPVNKYFQSAK